MGRFRSLTLLTQNKRAQEPSVRLRLQPIEVCVALVPQFSLRIFLFYNTF